MLKLTYISHSAFVLSDEKHTVAIDPFISENPTANISANEINPDFILVTHAHSDHLGDTVQLARTKNSLIITMNELAESLSNQGLPLTHAMNIGGSFNFPFGTVKMVQALHSSKISSGEYMGEPAGFVFNFGGKTIYHCGDTGLFSDMKLIGELSKPDIMLVPIGGNYTMGIDDAAKAVEFVQPQLAIPMHYNTFPIIKADPEEFVSKVAKIGKKAMIMRFGETVKFD